MEWTDEFKNKELTSLLIEKIQEKTTMPHTFMEVCGGHTISIRKNGIPSLLPAYIKLISGPGCPVCVTSRSYIDALIALSNQEGIILTTYGDLIRVPGTLGTLEKQKAIKSNIKIVYSITEAIKIAIQHPQRKIVFAAIGFETTAPGTAAMIKEAKNNNLKNFYILSAHKLMPPAMEVIAAENNPIEGFLAPGHVGAITGGGVFDFLAHKYHKAVVISGFEPTDILQSLLMLVEQAESNCHSVEIQYKRAVHEEGNRKALSILYSVFEPCNAWWRGFGMIRDSGLKLKKEYSMFDASNLLDSMEFNNEEPFGCRCGEVLRGTINPNDCQLYGKSCTPENPIGACMVASEGTCQAYYRYSLL
jgi:hydrogenase expression/formation protein HypD